MSKSKQKRFTGVGCMPCIQPTLDYLQHHTHMIPKHSNETLEPPISPESPAMQHPHTDCQAVYWESLNGAPGLSLASILQLLENGWSHNTDNSLLIGTVDKHSVEVTNCFSVPHNESEDEVSGNSCCPCKFFFFGGGAQLWHSGSLLECYVLRNQS